MKKKKKKTGSVAIPFLITFLISLVIIGSAAIFIYEKIDSSESSLVSMTNEVGTLSSKDDHTVFFVLDMSDTISSTASDYREEPVEEEDYYDEYSDEEEEGIEERTPVREYSRQPYTFMIMRSRPVDKQITFIGIPSDMLVGESNRQAQDVYIDNGVGALINSLEYSLDINIEKHMVFNTDNFKKVCNIIGGVNYVVPKEVEGVERTGDEQYLSADQIEAIISCGSYNGGELQRISTAASIISAMANQTSGERIAGNLDNSFTSVVEMTDTNITAVDYSNRRYAIKFMLKNSDPKEGQTRSTRANFITPYGTSDKVGFAADKYFSQDIKEYFKSDSEKTNSDYESDTQPDTKKED